MNSTIEVAGEFPFARGIHKDMYRQQPWTMRQYAGYGDAASTNERFCRIINDGGTGLSIAFDLPTQLGLDSDHALAVGEVGRVGVAIDTVDDLARVFRGIDLGTVTTSMTINGPAAVLLAFYLVAAEESGVAWDRVGGTVQNDILKEYAARGTYIYPPGPSLRLVVDLMGFCLQHVPKWNTVSVSGYHIREAGATLVEELAFTLGNGIEYLKAAIARGMDGAKIASRMSFFFSIDSDFFEEIAKLRAARRMWANIVFGQFGITDERAQKMRIHCQTAGSTLTQKEPDNNAVRVAYQAMAAVLGGCQSLHTNGRDEAISLPSEASVRLALRTQQILAYETGITAKPDPLGGSLFVEKITDRLETEALGLMVRVEQIGGMTEAISRGVIRRMIADSAHTTALAIEAGVKKIVGVNCFAKTDAGDQKELADEFVVDEQIEPNQIARLKAFKTGRDGAAVARALADLRVGAVNPETNLMPLIIKAACKRASLGEICGIMQEVFGEHRDAVSL